MKKLSEKDIIKIFQTSFGNRNFVSEDVETFEIDKKKFVTKVDTLVESTDIPKCMKIQDAARKSIVASVSDFSAKGVKPLFGMISVTIPKKFSSKTIKTLAKALGIAAKEFDLKILGGDTNEGKELVIQVTIFGITDRIVPRNGAKVNDIIFASGPFGNTAAGLKILQGGKKASKKFSQKAKKAFLRPNPRVKFALSTKKYFSSSMDSSDGLGITLHEMSKQSKKQFHITNLPIDQNLVEFATSNRINLLDLVFKGGEEYEIIFTASPKNRGVILKKSSQKKIPVKEIGYVSKGKGVIYHKGKKIIKIKNEGWQHFSN